MFVNMRVNDAEFEKCGDIILSAKSKIFALTCSLCNDVFLRFDDFKGHICTEHDIFLGLNCDSDVNCESEEEIEAGSAASDSCRYPTVTGNQITYNADVKVEVKLQSSQDDSLRNGDNTKTPCVVTAKSPIKNNETQKEQFCDKKPILNAVIKDESLSVEENNLSKDKNQITYNADVKVEVKLQSSQDDNLRNGDNTETPCVVTAKSPIKNNETQKEQFCDKKPILNAVVKDESLPVEEKSLSKDKNAVDILSVIELPKLSAPHIEMLAKSPKASLDYLSNNKTLANGNDPTDSDACAMDVDEDDCLESVTALNSDETCDRSDQFSEQSQRLAVAEKPNDEEIKSSTEIAFESASTAACSENLIRTNFAELGTNTIKLTPTETTEQDQAEEKEDISGHQTLNKADNENQADLNAGQPEADAITNLKTLSNTANNVLVENEIAENTSSTKTPTKISKQELKQIFSDWQADDEYKPIKSTEKLESVKNDVHLTANNVEDAIILCTAKAIDSTHVEENRINNKSMEPMAIDESLSEDDDDLNTASVIELSDDDEERSAKDSETMKEKQVSASKVDEITNNNELETLKPKGNSELVSADEALDQLAVDDDDIDVSSDEESIRDIDQKEQEVPTMVTEENENVTAASEQLDKVPSKDLANSVDGACVVNNDELRAASVLELSDDDDDDDEERLAKQNEAKQEKEISAAISKHIDEENCNDKKIETVEPKENSKQVPADKPIGYLAEDDISSSSDEDSIMDIEQQTAAKQAVMNKENKNETAADEKLDHVDNEDLANDLRSKHDTVEDLKTNVDEAEIESEISVDKQVDGRVDVVDDLNNKQNEDLTNDVNEVEATNNEAVAESETSLDKQTDDESIKRHEDSIKHLEEKQNKSLISDEALPVDGSDAVKPKEQNVKDTTDELLKHLVADDDVLNMSNDEDLLMDTDEKDELKQSVVYEKIDHGTSIDDEHTSDNEDMVDNLKRKESEQQLLDEDLMDDDDENEATATEPIVHQQNKRETSGEKIFKDENTKSSKGFEAQSVEDLVVENEDNDVENINDNDAEATAQNVAENSANALGLGNHEKAKDNKSDLEKHFENETSVERLTVDDGDGKISKEIEADLLKETDEEPKSLESLTVEPKDNKMEKQSVITASTKSQEIIEKSTFDDCNEEIEVGEDIELKNLLDDSDIADLTDVIEQMEADKSFKLIDNDLSTENDMEQAAEICAKGESNIECIKIKDECNKVKSCDADDVVTASLLNNEIQMDVSEMKSFTVDKEAYKKDNTSNMAVIEEADIKEEIEEESSSLKKSTRLSKFFEELEIDLDEDDDDLKEFEKIMMRQEVQENDQENKELSKERSKEDSTKDEQKVTSENVKTKETPIKNENKPKKTEIKHEKSICETKTDVELKKNKPANEVKKEDSPQIADEVDESMRLIFEADDTLPPAIAATPKSNNKATENTAKKHSTPAVKKRKLSSDDLLEVVDTPKRQKNNEENSKPTSQTEAEYSKSPTSTNESDDLVKNLAASSKRVPLSPKNVTSTTKPRQLIITRRSSQNSNTSTATTPRKLHFMETEVIEVKNESSNEKTLMTMKPKTPKRTPKRPNPVVRIKRVNLENILATSNAAETQSEIIRVPKPLVINVKSSKSSPSASTTNNKQPFSARCNVISEANEETNDIISEILSDVIDEASLKLYRPIDVDVDAGGILERVGLASIVNEGNFQLGLAKAFSNIVRESLLWNRPLKDYQNTELISGLLESLTKTTNNFLKQNGQQLLALWQLKFVLNTLSDHMQALGATKKNIRYAQELKHHFKFIIQRRIRLCEYCALVFCAEKKYEAHLEIHTNEMVRGAGGNTCPNCFTTLKTERNFENHVQKCKKE